MEFLDTLWLDQPLYRWFLALGIAAGAFIIFKAGNGLFKKHLRKKVTHTHHWVDDLFLSGAEKMRSWFWFSASIYIGTLFLKFSPPTELRIERIFLIIALLQVAVLGTSIISFFVERYVKSQAAHGSAAQTSIALIDFFARLVFMVAIILFGLNNLGVDITALIAGLGIGGIAVALALQNVLGDLFASLSIVLDKPFVVGDSISVDKYSGTIERIGLKTTRLKATSGEQLIFANNDLLKSRIQNFQRMQERRIPFTLSFPFDTAPEKLEMIPRLIRETLEAQSNVRFDRSHFTKIGETTFEFETVYFVTSSNYAVYMEIAQAVHLSLVRKFRDQEIRFGIPSPTLVADPRLFGGGAPDGRELSLGNQTGLKAQPSTSPQTTQKI